MDFELPEDHRALQSSLRAFCESRVKPFAREWDRAESLHRPILHDLGNLGAMGILTPEQYGGAGMDALAMSVAIEEVARHDGSLALTVASHNGLGSSHIRLFGSEAQKLKYLPKLASGEWLAAWALTEPGSGSDAAALRTTARREGDGWVIDGTKTFITQGSVGGFCVVLARTNPQAPKQQGITAFVVDRGTPGFSASKHLLKLGCRASDTAELSLDGVRVPDDHRVGEVDHGFADTMRILDRGRISIAAMALGLGYGALDKAVAYSKERHAFGKPIAQFQAVQWTLADAKAELDAAALLTHRAAWLADQGKPYSEAAAMAKLFASEAASRA